MSESQIDKNISNKNHKCYENEVVRELYNGGFRFCGNSKKDTAIKRAGNLVHAKYIRHIILAEAIDKDGNTIPEYLGLWVQYNTTIDEHQKEYDYYIIK